MSNKSIDELIKEYYEEFKGLPGEKPIVRNNQINDAFELVVLDVLYGKRLGLSFKKDNVVEISKYIVAPPDGGVDIFIEKTVGDESYFDVIQVKNAALSPVELKKEMQYMRSTISDYCKNPLKVTSENCREILSNSSLDKTTKNSCEYYIVHAGDTQDYSGIKNNEHIITKNELSLWNGNTKDCVEEDYLRIDGKNNYFEYGEDPQKKALICNINGFDLAELNNKYYSTEVGRNILYGWNLREQISKKSKSFSGMQDTITNCPDNFWFYNNGITIIAESVEEKQEDDHTKICLTNFSIVNGAQTTSSLGQILKDANRDENKLLLENLKKVYVMARILQVSDSEIAKDIAIYNNTQNPINTRDMVANRDEQKKLFERLMDDSYPQIYMEIRNGAQVPATFNKLFVHRKTTNEELAQLTYASFYQQPFTAKDKKKALFVNDYQNEYVLNKIYHDVFCFDEDIEKCGMLFRKTKYEIDEALFVQQLYKESKTYLRKQYKERIATEQEKLEIASDAMEEKNIRERIASFETSLEIVGICMYYFIATYYELQQFEEDKGKRYDFEKFYQDKEYKQAMVKDTATFFLRLTIEHLKKTAQENGKSANMNNWVRSATCQDAFFNSLREDISLDFITLEDKYKNYMDKYKKIDIA